jgi:hypothetical protein
MAGRSGWEGGAHGACMRRARLAQRTPGGGAAAAAVEGSDTPESPAPRAWLPLAPCAWVTSPSSGQSVGSTDARDTRHPPPPPPPPRPSAFNPQTRALGQQPRRPWGGGACAKWDRVYAVLLTRLCVLVAVQTESSSCWEGAASTGGRAARGYPSALNMASCMPSPSHPPTRTP